MKITTVLTITLIAATTGFAAGALLAPNKGVKTRRKIARKSNLYRDHLIDSFHDFVDSVTNQYDHLEDEAINLSKKATHKVNEVKAMAN